MTEHEPYRDDEKNRPSLKSAPADPPSIEVRSWEEFIKLLEYTRQQTQKGGQIDKKK